MSDRITQAAATAGYGVSDSASKVLRNTYMLLSMTLFFSAGMTALAVSLQAPPMHCARPMERRAKNDPHWIPPRVLSQKLPSTPRDFAWRTTAAQGLEVFSGSYLSCQSASLFEGTSEVNASTDSSAP